MALPQLRGLLRRQLYRDIVTAVTLGWIAGAGWWFGVAIPRRKLYEDFYKNYDAKAVADSMKASFEEGKWALFRNAVLCIHRSCHSLRPSSHSCENLSDS